MVETLKQCPFCGCDHAEFSTCVENEECENFEECPAEKNYVTVVCNARNGGCGASCGYHKGKIAAAKAWNRRAAKVVE